MKSGILKLQVLIRLFDHGTYLENATLLHQIVLP